jgi:hypothetical protein
MLNFTEEDQKIATKLVSIIGLGKFTVDIQQNVDLTKCLKFLQTLPAKIEANIFDQVEIHENNETE